LSPRLLVVIAVIVVLIVVGMVITVKRSAPGLRKGDPNAEAPRNNRGQSPVSTLRSHSSRETELHGKTAESKTGVLW
jgi:hypothetical protein